MTRLLVLVVIAACSAPARPIVDVAPPAPDAAPPAPPTAAELARDAHRERLLDQLGVVEVRAEGEGLIVDVCAPEVIPALDLTGIDVPVSPVAGDWPATARGEPCGCVDAGAYYAHGASIPVDCNTCTCENRQRAACTAMSCAIEILDRVYFTRNAALLDRRAIAVLDAVAAVLIQHPEVKVTIRGHADAGEVSVTKLSKKRASTVKAYLIEAGVPKGQLLGIEGVGSQEPLGQGAEADRTVQFVVAKQP